MQKILVGNLDFGLTEESLRSLFAPYGAVTSVNLIMDPTATDVMRSPASATVS